MIKIVITNGNDSNEYEFNNETEAIALLNELIDTAIELELNYLDDIGEELPDIVEKIRDLEKLDRSNILELEWNAELILGEYAEVEITEYSFYITDLLRQLGLNYDKSTMSKSIYVENNEGLLIRISDHKVPKISQDYGHKTPDIDLVYEDGIANNEDLNKHLGTNLTNETILL